MRRVQHKVVVEGSEEKREGRGRLRFRNEGLVVFSVREFTRFMLDWNLGTTKF